MSSAPTHILFECATGAAIFECVQTEEIGNKSKQVQESIKDLNTFGRMVKLVSFSPFKNALDALQSCLDVSEGAWLVFVWHALCSADLLSRMQVC